MKLIDFLLRRRTAIGLLDVKGRKIRVGDNLQVELIKKPRKMSSMIVDRFIGIVLYDTEIASYEIYRLDIAGKSYSFNGDSGKTMNMEIV